MVALTLAVGKCWDNSILRDPPAKTGVRFAFRVWTRIWVRNSHRRLALLLSEVEWARFWLAWRAGGPFKPGSGLSGAVVLLDKVCPPFFRVFAPSIRTRFLRVLPLRLRSGENCSIASLPAAHTVLLSPDCGGCSEASPQIAGSTPSLTCYVQR